MTAPLPDALADLAVIIQRCGGHEMDAVTFAACRTLAIKIRNMAAGCTWAAGKVEDGSVAAAAPPHGALHIDDDEVPPVIGDVWAETWPRHVLEVLGLEMRSDPRRDLGRGR